jgi:hypothetical protein
VLRSSCNKAAICSVSRWEFESVVRYIAISTIDPRNAACKVLLPDRSKIFKYWLVLSPSIALTFEYHTEKYRWNGNVVAEANEAPKSRLPSAL